MAHRASGGRPRRAPRRGDVNAQARTLSLFPGEAGPTVARAARPRGLVLIRDLARDTGTKARTLKNRLRRLDAKIGGGLLEKWAEDGQYLVRLDVLRKHLPELVTPQVVDALEEELPAGEQASNELAAAGAVVSELREVHRKLDALVEEVRQLRDVVVMGGP